LKLARVGRDCHERDEGQGKAKNGQYDAPNSLLG